MNDSQLQRYSRQILLPQIDAKGQEALLGAHALIIGLGGLGSPAAMYLAAAGVGKLTLVDHDTVDLSNLQRQIAHTTDRIGRPKTESAAAMLQALNPGSTVTAVSRRLEGSALDTAIASADVVLDCSDNFDTRFAVNAACVQASVPLVSGAAIRWEGQIGVFTGKPGQPCYRCLYSGGEQPEDTCVANGVVAPLVGIIGATQALEAVKLLTGAGQPLAGRLLLFDALEMVWRTLRLPKDPGCPVCGAGA